MSELIGEAYPGCEVCDILDDDKNEEFAVLVRGHHWIASLRDRDQTLLGTTFITLRRHAPELDYLTEEEESELIVVRNSLIKAIRTTFKPITFNFSCLKNDAFKEDITTPPEATHVHWHLKPRYGEESIEFAGETFQDPAPGLYLSGFKRHEPPREVAEQIAEAIKSNL